MLVNKILPKILKEDPLWKAFFDTADEVINAPLSDRITQLAERYNIDRIAPAPTTEIAGVNITGASKQLLVRNFARILGYHYHTITSDVSTFYRYVSEFSRFIPDMGTEKFLYFISYILDMNLTLAVLWYDPVHGTFHLEDDEEIQGRRVLLDGLSSAYDVYPTPYIRLYVDENINNYNFEDIVKLVDSVSSNEIVVKELYAASVLPSINFRSNMGISSEEAQILPG